MLSAVRGVSALVCALTAALAIAACGSSNGSGSGARLGDDAGYGGHSAASILADTLTATRSATAFALVGTLTDGGRTVGATLGYAAPSSLSARLTEGASVIRIVVVPAGSYLFANPAFWKQQLPRASAHELSVLADHWFKTTQKASSGFTRAFRQLTPAKIATCLASTVTRPTVSGTQTIDGQSAVVLHSTGGQSGRSSAILYVATRAPHHLLRLTETRPASADQTGCDASATGGSSESLTFSDWNHVAVTAPAGARQLP